MNKNILVIGITILFLGVAIAPLIQGIVTEKFILPICNGNTLYVGGSGPGNYTRIQDAIDNASDGDTVFVFNGTYSENLLLWKPIFLIGENRNNTIIYPKNVELNENSTIHIIVDNCSINGFTINNNDIETDIVGINVYSSGNMIIGNTINKFVYGIYIKDDINGHIFTRNNISNNEVSNCTYGIYVRANAKNNIIFNNDIIDNLEGINLYYCVNNSIVDNYVSSNTVYGIYINLNSDGNIVTRNVCTENRYGIRFKGVSYNEIYLNRLERNELGLYSCCGSSFNIIYKNTCIDNEKHSSDAFYNSWDNGAVGNFWDDYNGTDSDGDGIGDTPYPIPDGDNEDRYPLMESWNNSPPDAPIIDGPTKGKRGIDYDYTFVATDPDGDDIWYLIGWGDKEIIYIYGPFPSGEELMLSYNWSGKGTFTISAMARDIFDAESNWAYFEVEIPRTKATSYLWYQWFLERFPMLERLLSLLLQHLNIH